MREVQDLDDFRRDLEDNVNAINQARSGLLNKVRGLTADDLQHVRRGGWSVQQVLRHVIDSEVAYAKVIAFLRHNPQDIANASDDDVASGAAAADALERIRHETLSLLDGVDEGAFYELRALGKEEYSIVSVLENVASHDHEHFEQISKTLAAR
jgi:uncharacterized damage-inducible protein DinB